MNSDNKKIDNLIKIGVSMILLSGLIFATTTWNYYNDVTKVFMLLLGGITFRVVAYITEHKFNLEKSSFGYWIIANLFFIFSLVSIGYFKLFGSWYCFDGNGSYFLFSNIYTLIAVMCLRVYHKKQAKACLYISWVLSYIIMYDLFVGMGIPKEISLLLINFIMLLFEFIPNKDEYIETYQKTNSIATYVISGLYLILFSNSIIINILFIITAIFNIIHIRYKQDNRHSSVMIPIISSIFIIRFIISLNLHIDFICLSTVIILTLVSIIYMFLEDKLMKEFGLISNDFIIFIYFLILIFTNVTFALVAALLLLLVGVIANISNNSQSQKIIVPFKILILCCSIDVLLSKLYNMDTYLVYVVASFVFLAFSYLIKTKEIKYIYYGINMFLLIILASFINKSINYAPIIYLLLFINTIVNLLITNNENNKFKLTNYIITLVFIYTLTNQIFSDIGAKIAAIIGFLLLSFYKLDDNQKSLKVSLVANFVPIIGLSYEISIYNKELIIAIYSIIMALFYQFLFEEDNKSIAKIFIILPMIILFFGTNLETIILGTILIFYILIFYNKKEFHTIYQVSIIELIAIVIIRLSDFWLNIPLWLYLFIGGVIVTVFVTKKELNKDKMVDYYDDQESIEIKNQEKVEVFNDRPIEHNFCRYCGSKLYGDKKFCSSCGKEVNKK